MKREKGGVKCFQPIVNEAVDLRRSFLHPRSVILISVSPSACSNGRGENRENIIAGKNQM